MEKICLIVLQLLFCGLTYVCGGCPSAYSILPCKCEVNNEGKTIINCEQVQCSQELLSAITAAKKEKIYMVQLKAASFMFFPDEIFKDTKLKVLRIEDSSIFSLGERHSVFADFESLRVLEIYNCTFVNNWDFSDLSKMKKLRQLRLSSTELMELPNLNISHLPIEDLNFRYNYIEELPFRVFGNFTQLKRLSLDNNDITEIMRSMLPIPAKYLETIGLSYNKIKRLQINSFDQMPSLKYLYLGGNPIHILNEKTFKPVWHQLLMVLFQDCPLVCDCHLAWLTTAKQAAVVLLSGKCNSPENLKGQKLNHLLPKHFATCL